MNSEPLVDVSPDTPKKPFFQDRIHPKICPRCGKEYQPTGWNQRSCVDCRIPKGRLPSTRPRGHPRNPIPEGRQARNERKRRTNATARALQMQRRQGLGCLAEAIAQFPGGMKTFLPFVRACAAREPNLAPLIESFFKVHERERNAYKLEQMCMDLGISPHHVLAVCVEIASELKHDTTRMLSYLAMPIVMKRNIIEAKKPEGVEDRRMFMQSTGILPIPKGSSINVSATSQSAMLTKGGEPTGLPSFEDATVSFSEVIRRAIEVPQAALPEPTIDVEVE